MFTLESEFLTLKMNEIKRALNSSGVKFLLDTFLE